MPLWLVPYPTMTTAISASPEPQCSSSYSPPLERENVSGRQTLSPIAESYTCSNRTKAGRPFQWPMVRSGVGISPLRTESPALRMRIPALGHQPLGRKIRKHKPCHFQAITKPWRKLASNVLQKTATYISLSVRIINFLRRPPRAHEVSPSVDCIAS